MLIIIASGTYDLDEYGMNLRKGMVIVSPGYSWVKYKGTIQTSKMQDFEFPAFRENG